MENPSKKEKGRLARWFSKLRIRYRFVMVDDKTFDEKWSLRLSPLFLLLFFGGGAIVIIMLTTMLIAYTPLREYIPGYPDGTEREAFAENKHRVDELEKKLDQQTFYIERVKTILNGGVIPDSTNVNDTLTKAVDPNILSKAGDDEKAFRKKVEVKENKLKKSIGPSAEQPENAPAYFYVPVNGVISQSYNSDKNHIGIDISTAKDEPIKAVMEGTVIFAGYTNEGGFEIHVQHPGEIVSIYKHNAYLFPTVGQKVRGGETIAIAGNTGLESKGNHLHFELWDNGLAVDPEEYIGF